MRCFDQKTKTPEVELKEFLTLFDGKKHKWQSSCFGCLVADTGFCKVVVVVVVVKLYLNTENHQLNKLN